MGRFIGMDVHRDFAQIAMVTDGVVIDEGRVDCRSGPLKLWAATLGRDDQVALEATGNSDAIVAIVALNVARVVVSNPFKTRAIAEAKVKTDLSTREFWRSCWRRTSCLRCGCLMSGPG